MTTVKNLAIATVLATLVAAAFLTIVPLMESTYSTTIWTPTDQTQLSDVDAQREVMGAEVASIQGVLNKIKEGDIIGVIFGAPGAIISALKIILIDMPTVIHNTLTSFMEMLHLPTEVLYAVYVIVLLLVVFKILQFWSLGVE
jgi:hypothetical protein